MYQLRGRVGRRGENAFAYFFYPADKNNLKRETVDRLEAISTMTDLGSGYAIAERDLFIRGSGDVTGTAQHGTGSTGGFHIFYKLLEQELDRLRGVREIKLTSLKVYSTGSIPESYIPQESVDTLKKAYSILNLQLANYANNGQLNPVTAIFMFKNHFGYEDKTEVVVQPGKYDALPDTDKLAQEYIDTIASPQTAELPESAESDK